MMTFQRLKCIFCPVSRALTRQMEREIHRRMPAPAREINLIQTFSDTKVIGLTINHENMSDTEVGNEIGRCERELGIPVTDALTRSPMRLVEMVLGAFPELEAKLAARAA